MTLETAIERLQAIVPFVRFRADDTLLARTSGPGYDGCIHAIQDTSHEIWYPETEHIHTIIGLAHEVGHALSIPTQRCIDTYKERYGARNCELLAWEIAFDVLRAIGHPVRHNWEYRYACACLATYGITFPG